MYRLIGGTARAVFGRSAAPRAIHRFAEQAATLYQYTASAPTRWPARAIDVPPSRPPRRVVHHRSVCVRFVSSRGRLRVSSSRDAHPKARPSYSFSNLALTYPSAQVRTWCIVYSRSESVKAASPDDQNLWANKLEQEFSGSVSVWQLRPLRRSTYKPK